MLDAAMTGEVEDRGLAEAGVVEIAGVDEHAILLMVELADDLAVRRRDQRAADQVMAVLAAGLGDGHDPGRVLVGASLHREAVMEEAIGGRLVRGLRVGGRRIVAEHDHLHALQPHDAIGLGPAPVIADRHPEQAALELPDRETEIAGLEIALLEMLVRTLGVELGMARQMHLPVLADDPAGVVDQDRAVEMTALRRELGITEAHGHAELSRPVEERLCVRPGHGALEPMIGLGAILMVPAREEGGQRQLRIDDEGRALRLGLFHQRNHAVDDLLAAVGPLDRTQLSCGDCDDSWHGVPDHIKSEGRQTWLAPSVSRPMRRI